MNEPGASIPNQASGSSRTSARWLPWASRWVWPFVVAVGVIGAEGIVRRVAGTEVPRKGQVSQRTWRAEGDMVLDLHATFAREAEQARESYLPIYLKDDKLLHRDKEPIVAAAMSLSLASWNWAGPSPSSRGDGAVGPEDAGPVAGDGAASSQPAGRSAVFGGDGGPRSLAPEAGPGGPATSGDLGLARGAAGEVLPSLSWKVTAARRRDLQALLYGCFKFMEPYYEAGVIADAEFPNEKSSVRLFAYEHYHRQQVAGLRRFSELRPMLERYAEQFFYRVPDLVRSQAIDFILQRLPANLRYAEANRKHIADMSQVTGLKVVMVRRGEVVLRRGHSVDIRADNALRVIAAQQRSWKRRASGRLVLVAVLMLVFCLAGTLLFPAAVRPVGVFLVVGGALVALALGGHLALAWWAIHPLLLPQAAVALIIAVVVGRRAAVVTALIVAAGLGVSFFFDLEAMFVAAFGGVVGACAVRHRRRGALWSVGILVGLAQALAAEACRAAAGRPQTYGEMWMSGQAFFGGVGAGLLALAVVPFVQRAFGMASRGELKALADYDHPLARQLRERLPEVFTHTLRVINLADAAAKNVGADRLLVRVAALFHDIGKLEAVREDPGAEPAVRAHQRRAHLGSGVELASRQRLPRELIELMSEHHGSCEMPDLMRESHGRGESLDRAACSFNGRRPQSLESAILMIANQVEGVSREEPNTEPTTLVEQVVIDLTAQHQLAECGATHWQVRGVQEGIVAFLVESRRLPDPGAATGA